MQTEGQLRHFVPYASHDLQEPLRAVSGCSKLHSNHLGDRADATTQRLGFLIGAIGPALGLPLMKLVVILR